MLGLNDTVTVKSKVHVSDGRGGVTTTYSIKIASLVCSLQPVRREELYMDFAGQEVLQPYMLLFENITAGSTVEEGDIIVHGTTYYLVISVTTASGKGTHTEAILRKSLSDASVK